MESTIKFDRVVLVKELNENFCKIGEVYEVANVLENAFLLRDANTRVAIGVVNFSDFENCFIHEENYKGWSKWQKFNGVDGQSDCVYRTNRRKTQVKFLTDKVMGESFANKCDEFNLYFGLNLAYLRARNKVLMKKMTEHQQEFRKMEIELIDNERVIKDMINRLES